MTDQIVDIERRLELAAQELLKAFTLLTNLTTVARVFIRRDTSHAADYPCALIQAIGFAEFGLHTGWYKGALQLSGQTYREDDKSRGTLKQILGAARAFGQQTDLATQFNATAIATTEATALDVRDASLEGGSFDASEDKIQEDVLTLAVVCRPSQDIVVSVPQVDVTTGLVLAVDGDNLTVKWHGKEFTVLTASE